ncbi:alpha/beta-hydrolase [Pilatotrama ljubarskyi]|nr:alpha/beta-hydrolase [Pilatotrama ljubarskyi]
MGFPLSGDGRGDGPMATTTTHITAWLTGPDGHRFYTRTYTTATRPPTAVLLFVHGFNDYISRHEDTHAEFARRGFDVFAYDMRGFGRTAMDEENRSPDEVFGKTSRSIELADLEWWVRRVVNANKAEGIPVFLMGYSAGGGLALAFATRAKPAPTTQPASLLSGVIATAPLVGLTHPPPRPLRLLVGLISVVWPTYPVPAVQPPERFSRDPKVIRDIAEDPARKSHGTAKGLYDMISQGREMLQRDWERWPNHLPLLMLWGSADEVNSPNDGIAFFEKVRCNDKRLVKYEDARHELMHEVDVIRERFIDECVQWMATRSRGQRLRSATT